MVTDVVRFLQRRRPNRSAGSANSSTFRLDNVQNRDAGDYTVTVANSAGTATAGPATLTVQPLVVPPAIVNPPQNQTVTEGASVAFSVTATGTAPLTYQWLKNGESLPGASAASLSFSAVRTTDTGNYSVVVSNSAGAVTGGPALLTVKPLVALPSINVQPLSQTNAYGGIALFQVAATGTAPLAYQWRKDGTNIDGAIGAILTLSDIQDEAAGTYSVMVTNEGGSTTSSPALLTVDPAPVFTIQPKDLTVDAGASVTLTVKALGKPPLAYRWQKDGFDLPGITTATLTLFNVRILDSGAYTVVASNPSGSVTSAPAVLTVIAVGTPPEIVVQPASQASFTGNSIVFSVSAKGDETLAFQWQLNGTPIPGANADHLELSNLQLTNAGACTVVVSNPVGSAIGGPALLTVQRAVRLSPPAPLGGGLFKLTVTGERGEVYELQASSDASTWTAVAGLVNINGAVVYIDPSGAEFPQRFYRVLLKP